MDENEQDVHPWVLAAQLMEPQPIPAHINMKPVTLEQEVGEVDAVEMNIIDPTGIKTIYFPPQVLQQIVMQGAQILDLIAQKQNSGLIVADKNMEEQAKAMHNQNNHLRSV